MMKKNALVITVMAVMFALSVASLMADGKTSLSEKEPQEKSLPFLITGKLPHLTKLLMQKWDHPELNLSDEQKNKLMVVREETISAVKRISKEIAPLEQQVAEGIFTGKKPEELRSLVQKIAELKSEATMVHLRCIYATNGILDEQQQKFLQD